MVRKLTTSQSFVTGLSSFLLFPVSYRSYTPKGYDVYSLGSDTITCDSEGIEEGIGDILLKTFNAFSILFKFSLSIFFYFHPSSVISHCFDSSPFHPLNPLTIFFGPQIKSPHRLRRGLSIISLVFSPVFAGGLFKTLPTVRSCGFRLGIQPSRSRRSSPI